RDLRIVLKLAKLGPIDGFDVRTASRPGSGDDIEHVIAVEIGGGDTDASCKSRIIGIELAYQGAIGDHGVVVELAELGSINDLDVRSAAGVSAGDNFGECRIGEAEGHENSAGKAR